ncbi:hypothetical protein D1007_20427 [Hordeum vulgare]|nr:hypothetical protein D1007_20427 [Hordeum vulgare]
MAKADKYATADSAMHIKVTASDKTIPMPSTPKPAGDNRGGQKNNKRKADQMDSRSNSKLVPSMEGETSAPHVGPPRKHSNRNNANWLPRQSFEQLLDAPCKIHSGAQPSNHTLRHCSFARRLSQGDGLPAPPVIDRLPAVGLAGWKLRNTRIGEKGVNQESKDKDIKQHAWQYKYNAEYIHSKCIGPRPTFITSPSGWNNKKDTGYGAAASSVAPAAAPEVVASPSPAAPEAVAPSPS